MALPVRIRDPVGRGRSDPKPRRTHREGFDAPDEDVLLGDVADAADGRFEFGRVGVGRHRHHHLHVVGRRPAFELRTRLQRFEHNVGSVRAACSILVECSFRRKSSTL